MFELRLIEPRLIESRFSGPRFGGARLIRFQDEWARDELSWVEWARFESARA